MKKSFGLNQTWRGWHWQFILVIVVVLGALQTVADIWFRYPLTTSMPLAILLTIYLVVPRTKEQGLANTIASVILMFLVDLLLQFSLPLPANMHATTLSLLEMDAYVLVFGLIMAFVFLRLTRWSDKKRIEMENKRSRTSNTATKPEQVRVRRHRWKKKPKKKR